MHCYFILAKTHIHFKMSVVPPSFSLALPLGKHMFTLPEKVKETTTTTTATQTKKVHTQ